MGMITLDVAPYGHECDCCQNSNYRRPGMTEPKYVCAIYTLTIGAGYRQPSYLCPNCLGVLRVTLGVKNQHTTLTEFDRRASAAQGFRVLPGITDRNTEESI